jgi:hypothetical protein
LLEEAIMTDKEFRTHQIIIKAFATKVAQAKSCTDLLELLAPNWSPDNEDPLFSVINHIDNTVINLNAAVLKVAAGKHV